MNKQTHMPAKQSLLPGFVHSVLAMALLFAIAPLATAQDKQGLNKQISAADLAFIEQLGSPDEDLEGLQTAMEAYNKNKQTNPAAISTNQDSSSEQNSNGAAQTPSGKKVGAKP